MAIVAQWYSALSSKRRSEVRFTAGLSCYFVFTTNITLTALLRLCKNMYLKTLRFISLNMSISPEVALGTGTAIHGGTLPIKGRKGRGVNWFTYCVAVVGA